MDLMCFANRVPRLCCPSMPRGVWPASELIRFPAVLPSHVVQSCFPAVFPTSGQRCMANRGFSQIVVSQRYQKLVPSCTPAYCATLFPSCVVQINFQLVSNDVVQIVYPILFWGRRRYNLILSQIGLILTELC